MWTICATQNSVAIDIIIDNDLKELIYFYSNKLNLSQSRFCGNIKYLTLNHYELLDDKDIRRQVINFASVLSQVKEKYEICNSPALVACETTLISVLMKKVGKNSLRDLSRQLGMPMKTLTKSLLFTGLVSAKLVNRPDIKELASLHDTRMKSLIGSKVS